MKALKGIGALTVAVTSMLLQSCTAHATCTGEAERARDIRDRIEHELPLRGGDPVVEYVRDLGTWLALTAGVDQEAWWRFQVVRDRSVNAFSIGDGRIYITEGAILAAINEAELAGVIAHEMGHQLAGHFCPSSRERYSQGSHVDNGDTRRGGNGSAAPGLGTLRQGMDPLKEREADRIAVRLLTDVGLDPSVRSNVITRAQSRGSQSLHDSAVRSRGNPTAARQTEGHNALVGEAAFLRAKQILVMESR